MKHLRGLEQTYSRLSNSTDCLHKLSEFIAEKRLGRGCADPNPNRNLADSILFIQYVLLTWEICVVY